MILLDSDRLSVLLEERDFRNPQFKARLQATTDDLAIPIICIEEQLRGWLAKINSVPDAQRQIIPYRRLKRAFTLLRQWPIADWDDASAANFIQLKHLRHRIGTQDLKIACTALANDALLLSANLRDFQQVPGLKVADWLI